MTIGLTLPRHVMLGPGELANVRGAVDLLRGERVLIVHGRHSDELVAGVREQLGDRVVGDFGDSHTPTDNLTFDAVGEVARSSSPDLVVAIGGGSSIDAGKCAVHALGPAASLLAVVTTLSGAELTADCGVVDLTTKNKQVLHGSHLMAKSVIYDIDLFNSLPLEIAAGSGMNALAHCVEALYTPKTSDLLQSIACSGAAQLLRGLRALGHGERAEIWCPLVEGAFAAGIACGNASIALHHVLCHYVGPKLGIQHGVTNSIMLPHAMRFNKPAAEAGFRRLALALQVGDRPEDAVEAIYGLHRDLGIPHRLGQFGLTDAIAADIASHVVAHPRIANNPRPVTEEDVRQILSAAA